MKLSSLTPSALLNAGKMLLMIPSALIVRRFKKGIWIITERPDQARDNGYVFFKYLREKHPDQPVVYIIESDALDRQKVVSLGKVIPYGGWRHIWYYCLSKVHISAHIGGCNIPNNPFARYIKRPLSIKDIFLPHGVSYGISEFCLAKYAKIDLFITSGKPEYDNVLANYGYVRNQVVYTGFPRLDGWHHIKVDPKKIVLMPTWRLYLSQNSNTVFTETEYYKAYQDLINSPRLTKFLTENMIKLVFYPHHEMRKYVNDFHTECSAIEVVYRDETYDIQELLKESALLITDYSSVHFDFAYMGKPVLYYQFDREEFWKKQYMKTDFDAKTDGFGPVAYDLHQLEENLKESFAIGFKLEGEYEQRMKAFYVLRDEHNCDRVYEEITKRWWIKK